MSEKYFWHEWVKLVKPFKKDGVVLYGKDTIACIFKVMGNNFYELCFFSGFGCEVVHSDNFVKI